MEVNADVDAISDGNGSTALFFACHEGFVASS
jgi:hypothetical protein